MTLCKSNGRVMNILAGVLEESKRGLICMAGSLYVTARCLCLRLLECILKKSQRRHNEGSDF